MTRASDTRPTRRLVESPVSGEYVLEVYQTKLRIRPKGTRRGGPAEMEVAPGQLYDRLMIANLEYRKRAKARMKRAKSRR